VRGRQAADQRRRRVKLVCWPPFRRGCLPPALITLRPRLPEGAAATTASRRGAPAMSPEGKYVEAGARQDHAAAVRRRSAASSGCRRVAVGAEDREENSTWCRPRSSPVPGDRHLPREAARAAPECGVAAVGGHEIGATRSGRVSGRRRDSIRSPAPPPDVLAQASSSAPETHDTQTVSVLPDREHGRSRTCRPDDDRLNSTYGADNAPGAGTVRGSRDGKTVS